jgi:hypothetical protein
MLLPRFIGTGGLFPGLYLRPHSRLFIPLPNQRECAYSVGKKRRRLGEEERHVARTFT